MSEQRIKELFSDETFVLELLEQETVEEAQAAFKEKDVEVSADELNKLRDHINARFSENGEMSLEALDDVAGGWQAETLSVLDATLQGALHGAIIGSKMGPKGMALGAAAVGAVSAAIAIHSVTRGLNIRW